MKILVCDDIEKRGREVVKEVERAGLGHTVELLALGAFKSMIEVLIKQGEPFLEGRNNSETSDLRSPLQDREIDMVILDNNLAELRIPGARHTAEALAGHLRAFTSVPYIVSLNKNPLTDFDLRFLIGDYQTVTDVALNTEHLSTAGLWTGVPVSHGDFLPWYWPRLNDAPERRRRQIDYIEEHLEEPLLAALGFDEDGAPYLTRHARGAVLRDAGPAAGLEMGTFRDFFVSSCRSLPIEMERRNVVKLMESPDEGTRRTTRRIVARIVAAEVDRWFRRDVLGPQNLLVDVPHLLVRMPFLLGEGAGDLDRWNECLSATTAPFGLSSEHYWRFLKPARYSCDLWTDKPCFWWPRLDRDSELNAMFSQSQASWASAVFCEDLSRFRAFVPEEAGRPQEFAAEFEGGWSQRYVEVVDGPRYTPKSRFAI